MTSLVEQLMERLRSTDINLPDANRLSFFVMIKDLREDMAELIREIFKKHYLLDDYLGHNEAVFLFEVYKQPLNKQPGTKDFMSALKELDKLGVRGIVELCKLGDFPPRRVNGNVLQKGGESNGKRISCKTSKR